MLDITGIGTDAAQKIESKMFANKIPMIIHIPLIVPWIVQELALNDVGILSVYCVSATSVYTAR
jgi:hypothetical protein